MHLVPPRLRVLLVGLGAIAQTHADVLRSRTDVEIVGGVDPVASLDGVTAHRTLDDAWQAGPAPDLVVVATPTDTHITVVREALSRTDGLVLSEKPLATAYAEIDALGEVADRVRVAHHFAFSPEVEWALRFTRDAGWSRPTRVVSVFHDAFVGRPASFLASHVSTWVDSGPNQLTVLMPFVGACRVVSHSDERERAVTALEHDGGRTLLTSNWLAADTSKQTTLEYAGDRVVRMDHTSMTVTVLEGGGVREQVGYAGTAGRKEAHYRGLYDVLLSGPDDARLGVPLAAEVARVLEAAVDAPPARVTWSTIGDA
jgi:predicted dehydrogenase